MREEFDHASCENSSPIRTTFKYKLMRTFKEEGSGPPISEIVVLKPNSKHTKSSLITPLGKADFTMKERQSADKVRRWPGFVAINTRNNTITLKKAVPHGGRG